MSRRKARATSAHPTFKQAKMMQASLERGYIPLTPKMESHFKKVVRKWERRHGKRGL